MHIGLLEVDILGYAPISVITADAMFIVFVVAPVVILLAVVLAGRKR
jgi:hypothetical protein